MQIQFDPRDPNACASVLAIITALHGSAPQALPDGPAPEMPDPAAAFDAPNPEAAFPPVPFAPPAETASAAPAPATPSAPVASPSSGVELDADGLPWDARIHSGPADKRPKNADGRWRRARGADDATVAAVTAELRQVMGAPAPAPTQAAAPTPPPAPEPAPAPVSPPPPPVATAPTPAPAAPPSTPDVAGTESGPAAAAPAVESVATFADLMKKITRMQTAGLVTVEGTAQIAQSLGLTGVRDMINRPDLVPAFDALLPAEVA